MTNDRQRKTLRIYESAFDLNSAQRHSFLDEQCADDSVLRRDVETMLAACEGANDFLDSPVLGSEFRIGDVIASQSLAEEDIVPGNRVGKYVVEELIATGGMGAVYRVHDSELGRDLAVKVLRRVHVGKSHLSQRFLEEAQIAGQLEHPGIVPIHEIGTTEDGRPYIAMKLIRGETFSKLLRERKNLTDDRQRLIRIFEQICRPVAYVHASDVVHRDLKPSNILVGSFGEVQVTDWGLAKVLPQTGTTHHPTPEDSQERLSHPRAAVETVRSGSSSDESLAGSVIGTPAYMAPEQAQGKIQHVDRRSDVFALGAILCEILTGDPPYFDQSRSEQLAQAASGEHSQADERLAKCGADRQLIDIALQCLAKDPHDRPNDAGQVSTLVRAYFTSIEQRARSLEIRVAKSRLRTLLVGTVLLATIAVAGGLFWSQHARQQRRNSASSRVQEAVGEARVLEAIARNSPSDDESLWNAALQAILAVESTLSADVDQRLQNETNDLARSIESQFRDARFLAHLERIRNDEIITFSTYDVGDEYHEAFSNYLGTEFDSLPLDEVIARFNNSDITKGLAIALDEWALTQHINSEDWQNLAATSSALSPSAWRQELYGVIGGTDIDLLSQFAASHSTSEFPNSLRSLLASLLVVHSAKAMDKAFALEQQRSQESARQQRRLQENYRDAAVLLLRQAVSLEPSNYRFNLRLGQLLSRSDNEYEAIAYLRAACVLKPNRRRAWMFLVDALVQQDDGPGAIRAFLQQLRLPGDHAIAFSWLIPLLEQSTNELPTELTNKLVDACENIYANDIGREAILNQILGLAWRRLPGRIAHDESLRLVQEYVQRTRRKEPLSLALLAEINSARDEHAEAVRNLEEARQLVDDEHWQVEKLHFYRETLRPGIASYTSLDAAFAQQQAKTLLVTLRSLPETSATRAHVAYLEGRLAEEKDRNTKAMQQYRLAMSLDNTQVEPAMRLSSILDTTGATDEAETVLHEQILSMEYGPQRLWKRWAVIALAGIKQKPNQILGDFPKAIADASLPPATPIFVPHAEWARDLRRLLTRLNEGHPIRINCGGPDYRDPTGAMWMRDSFFLAGSTFNNGLELYPRQIAGTDLDPLYQTERWGNNHLAYDIPLPPGEYEVSLHFAEIYAPMRRGDSLRVFDIRVEQEIIRPVLNIRETAGFATSLVIRHITHVTDGSVDISLHASSDNPKISAVEIKQLD